MRRSSSVRLGAVGGGLFLALLALSTTACKPTYPKCDSDKDCREKEYCVNQQCQQCRDSRDCKEGEVCQAGRCELAPKCTDDSQCPANQSCIDGKCKACASDDQCGAGGKCDKGRCKRAGAETGGGTGGTGGGGGGECQLEPIYFDFNESSLSTEATASIERVAECLKKSTKSVQLVGHTDPRGTEEYNLALSEKRAQAVKDRLVRLGIDGSRLRTVPKGEIDATGTDESGWSKDRRVDVQ
jgi:peptidoglycan-associated lipoprotein